MGVRQSKPQRSRGRGRNWWARPALALLPVVAVAAAAPAGAATGLRAGVKSPMSGWVERSRGDFTAFMPPAWGMVASQNGTDISSPTGTAVVSFAYATEDPQAADDAQVLNYTLSALGFTGVRVVKQGAPYAYAGSERQVTELTGYQSGAARHAIISVEVFNNYAYDSFGFDANLQMAPASAWARYEPTMRLVADHIYFFGHVPAELAPGHCGLDPADQKC